MIGKSQVKRRTGRDILVARAKVTRPCIRPAFSRKSANDDGRATGPANRLPAGRPAKQLHLTGVSR